MAAQPVIFTTLGLIDEALLTKSEGLIDNDVELTTWQEWRLGDVIVKREAQVRLKPLAATADMGIQ